MQSAAFRRAIHSHHSLRKALSRKGICEPHSCLGAAQTHRHTAFLTEESTVIHRFYSFGAKKKPCNHCGYRACWS